MIVRSGHNARRLEERFFMPKTKSSSQTRPIDLDNTQIAFAALSDYQLKQAWLLFRILGQPTVVKLGPSLADLALKLHLPLQGIIKKTIFSHFCGGETIQACLPRIGQLWSHQVGTILDFAREGGGKEFDFDLVQAEIISSIDMAAQHRDSIPFAVFKPTGVASMGLLSKKARGQALSRTEREAFDHVRKRFETICAHASLRQVRIMIDAEESWIQNAVDTLVTELIYGVKIRLDLVPKGSDLGPWGTACGCRSDSTVHVLGPDNPTIRRG